MRRRRALAGLLLFAPVAFVAAQTPAPPPVAVPTFRVVYFEVAPSEVNRAIALLRTYRQAVQKARGVTRVEMLQQIGRPNLFAIEDTWGDGASLQAHLESAEARKFRDDLRSALISPLDERLLAPITAQPGRGGASDQTIHVVTHADAAARREEIPGMLQELASGARREKGNVLFDVTVQPNRTNHFTLLEAWTDQKAYEAHVITDNTRKFRAAFAPVSGALYDERIYRTIP